MEKWATFGHCWRREDAGWEDLQIKVRAVNRKLQSNALTGLRKERAKLEGLLAEVPQSQPDRQRHTPTVATRWRVHWPAATPRPQRPLWQRPPLQRFLFRLQPAVDEMLNSHF